MAKTALIERELKRAKLVAKYAKKHAEFKAISTDAKKSEEERAAARLALQKLPRNANPTRQRAALKCRGTPRVLPDQLTTETLARPHQCSKLCHDPTGDF